MLNRKNASCLNLTVLDFPDGPVFESLPAKSGDTGLILGTGRFTSHGQLSPHVPEPVLCNKRSHCNEKPVHCN